MVICPCQLEVAEVKSHIKTGSKNATRGKAGNRRKSPKTSFTEIKKKKNVIKIKQKYFKNPLFILFASLFLSVIRNQILIRTLIGDAINDKMNVLLKLLADSNFE